MVVKPCFSPLILDDVKTQIHVINNNQKIAFFFELVAAASIAIGDGLITMTIAVAVTVDVDVDANLTIAVAGAVAIAIMPSQAKPIQVNPSIAKHCKAQQSQAKLS